MGSHLQARGLGDVRAADGAWSTSERLRDSSDRIKGWMQREIQQHRLLANLDTIERGVEGPIPRWPPTWGRAGMQSGVEGIGRCGQGYQRPASG
jgi:hypothetical protein